MPERSPLMGIGGLKVGLSGPPLDCNNSCMDGECSCSGNWRVLAYDAEGVEALVAERDQLKKALERIANNVGWGDYYACSCITDPKKQPSFCDCAPRLRQLAKDALSAGGLS